MPAVCMLFFFVCLFVIRRYILTWGIKLIVGPQHLFELRCHHSMLILRANLITEIASTLLKNRHTLGHTVRCRYTDRGVWVMRATLIQPSNSIKMMLNATWSALPSLHLSGLKKKHQCHWGSSLSASRCITNAGRALTVLLMLHTVICGFQMVSNMLFMATPSYTVMIRPLSFPLIHSHRFLLVVIPIFIFYFLF